MTLYPVPGILTRHSEHRVYNRIARGHISRTELVVDLQGVGVLDGCVHLLPLHGQMGLDQRARDEDKCEE
jgi:hypothetical protein